MPTQVLVTGAAGFIGSHLVEALAAAGCAVRSLVLPGSATANLQGANTEVVYGDIRDPSTLRPALAGVDTVYHLAALSRHDARVPDADYRDVNVLGTRNVLEAADAAGARRLLFTATIEAVGMSPDGRPLTEDTPQQPRNIYGRTKLEAENMVRTFAARRGLQTVVVRPPMTYGPRELLLCARMFKPIQFGLYPVVGDGLALMECCYVKNQVQGIRLAAERGPDRSVYFISDERSYTFREIVLAIARELGVRVRTPRLPVPLAYALGWTAELAGRVLPFHPFLIRQTGRPPFSRKTVAWTKESRLFVDIGKARRELGYQPAYTLQAGLRETIAWYRQHGHLRARRAVG